MPTLWPFCPSETFTESLAWRTDVIPTYSAEQRIALTHAPRQTLNLAHTFTARQYERAKALFRAVQAGAWYLPLWHERQRVTVASGASSVTVDTTVSDYRSGGYALLWSSDEACEVVEIAGIFDTSITLVGTASRAYTDALCCPVRIAYCPDGLDASRSVQPIVPASCEWQVFDDTDLADGSLYTTYRTHPIVTDAPRIGAGSISERLSRKVEIVDNGISTPFYDDVVDRMANTLAVAWMPTTLSGLWSLRKWLHYLKGKQRAFWVPDWTKGITLAADIAPASTTVTIRAIGLDGGQESGDLMLVTATGTTYLQFTAAATSGANEVLTLSGAAGVTIAASSVVRACLLRFVRLAQDRVELEHRHRGAAGQITSVFALCEEVPVP